MTKKNISACRGIINAEKYFLRQMVDYETVQEKLGK